LNSICNSNKRQNKKEKDPLKPKHPISAYFLFTNDRREALLAEKKGIMEVIELYVGTNTSSYGIYKASLFCM
jgi:hypothetical protein